MDMAIAALLKVKGLEKILAAPGKEPFSILWDCNIEGRTPATVDGNPMAYLVSDAVLTSAEISGATYTVSTETQSVTSLVEENAILNVSGLICVMTHAGIGGLMISGVAGSYTDADTGETWELPVDGTYMSSMSPLVISQTFTAPTENLNGAPFVMQDGKPVWGGTIDPKFLPEGVGGGDLWINLADYGINAMSFVDDSGSMKRSVQASITEEQLFDLMAKMKDEKCRGFYASFAMEQDGVTYYVRYHFHALMCGCSPLPIANCITYDMEDSGEDKMRLWSIGSTGDDLALYYIGKINFAE